jgi:hypothetical protein
MPIYKPYVSTWKRFISAVIYISGFMETLLQFCTSALRMKTTRIIYFKFRHSSASSHPEGTDGGAIA